MPKDALHQPFEKRLAALVEKFRKGRAVTSRDLPEFGETSIEAC